MSGSPYEGLVSDCCICKGQVTRMARGIARVFANGKEYCLYYHESCLNDDTKKVVEQMLNDMIAKDQAGNVP